MWESVHQLLVYSLLLLFLGSFLWFIKSRKLLQIIRRSRNRFKTLVDLSPYGMALTDQEGVVVSANKALADMIGCEVQTLIGQNLPERLGMKTEGLRGKIQALSSGQVLEFPIITVKSKDKELLHIRPCLFFDSAQKDALFWHVADQTTSFRLESKFSDLIKNVPIGLFWADLNGVITLANPAFKEIFSHGEIPDSMEGLLTSKGWESIRRKLFEEGGTQETGLLFYLQGKRINLALKLKLCDQGGAPCLAGILKDVTEQVRLNESLKEAYRKAEAASKAKSTFLSHMSHELRTPLNVIQGMAALLEDMISEPGAMELVTDLRKASELLTSLIGDILDLAKIESGKLDLNNEPFDMKLLLDEIEAVLGIQAHLKDLDFTAKLSDTTHRYYKGDPLRIRQIIFNLAGNGLKLTKKGGITILVQAVGKTEDGRSRLEIRVSDTGPGIPPEDLPRLFNPFSQAEDGKKAGGTGLGLSITKELAELMEGNITVESVVGVGTTFYVEIVLEEALESDLAADASNESKRLVEPGRALVVDDVGMNRKVLRMFLEKMGWWVKEAENGQAALDILAKSSDFHVIFMDISMPVMDGLEATRRIKKMPALSNIPVVAVTAHAMSDDKEKFLKAGMDGYVPKPVKFGSLQLEMSRLLGGGHREPGKEVRKAKASPADRDDITAISGAREEILDFDALIATCQGMKELARELVSDLIKECPKWLKEAEEAVSSTDEMRIRKICHLIKGTALTVHAGRLHRAADILGQAAKDGKLNELSSGLEQLRHEVFELEKWIRSNFNVPEALESLESIKKSASDSSLITAA